MNIITHDVEFWMVWTKQGWPPKRQHATDTEAHDEARRLAVQYPRRKFIVLKAISKVQVDPAEQIVNDLVEATA